MRFFHEQSGHTLVEAIVAIGILTSGVLGIITLAVQSIQVTDVAESKAQAEYLAQEGLETMRAWRDNDGSSYFTAGALSGPTLRLSDVVDAGIREMAVDSLGQVCTDGVRQAGGVTIPDCTVNNAGVTRFGDIVQGQLGPNNFLFNTCPNPACTSTKFNRVISYTLEPVEGSVTGEQFMRVTSTVSFRVRGFSSDSDVSFTTDLYPL